MGQFVLAVPARSLRCKTGLVAWGLAGGVLGICG